MIPSRKFPNPARLAHLVEQPLDPKRCFDGMVKHSSAQMCERARAGLADNPTAWRPAVEAAIQNALQPQARGPLEVDVEVAAVTLGLYSPWTAVPWWLAEGGCGFALRALIRCHDVAREADRNHVVERRDVWQDGVPLDRSWELLRCVLAEAIEPVYDEAYQIADRARLEGNAVLELSVAFAFPDQPAWAKSGAQAAASLSRRRHAFDTIANYLTVAPLASAKTLAGYVSIYTAGNKWATILAHHGADAAPVIAVALSRAPNDRLRTELCRYMLAIRTEEAQRELVKLAGGKKGVRVFEQAAARHRTLI